MSRIIVGNVTSEGDRLIHKYLEKFMPDAVVEPLKASGIKSKLKMHAKRPDVAFIIIDEPLYQQCAGTIDDVLQLPKVHKYTTDSSLKEFLISKFGVIDDIDETPEVIEEVPSIDSDSVVETETTPEVLPETSGTDLDFGYTGAFGGMQTSVSSDEEIERLEKELEQSKMLVKNLTRQLQNSGDDSDIAVLVNRIKELDKTIKERDTKISELENESYIAVGKVAKAEEAIVKLSSTEAELKHQREVNAEANYNITELKKKISESENKIVSLESYKKQYEETKEQLEKVQSEYKHIYANYESKCDEYNVLLTRAENAEKGSTSVNKQVKELNVKIVEMQSQLETKAKTISSLELTGKDAKSKIDSLNEQVKELTKNLSEANNKVTSLESELRDANERVSNLEKELSDTKEELTMALDENTKLEKDLNDEKTKVSETTDKLLGVQEKLGSANSELESYKTQVEALNLSIKDLRSKSEDLAKLTDELNSCKADLTERDNKIKELEVTIKVQTDEAVSLDNRLKAMSSSIGNNKELESKVESLQTELNEVRNQLISKREEFTKLSEEKEASELQAERVKLNLESTVSDKDREIKNLESEIELLKRGEDKEGKTAELRLKILDLQEENQALKRKQDTGNVEEIIKLKEELSSIKMRSVDLEMELAERDEREKEVQSSIFTAMSNCALPRLTIDARVEVPDIDMPKCHVVASGSAESNMSLYKTIKNTCISNQGKKIIIVDLSSDSYIDAEFRMQRVPSPMNWLMGTEAISNFVADTYLGNVKVISSSLVYTNPLYFLSVNWVLRLQELNSLAKHADILIINVGTLNDVVSKILFQSFASVMKSHVVLRATPINIRTAFLSFAGIKNMSKAEIACVNFDNASKKMYQKLASKYNKSRILRDTEGLGV